jgi:hypothetical protein
MENGKYFAKGIVSALVAAALFGMASNPRRPGPLLVAYTGRCQSIRMREQSGESDGR